MGLAGSPSHPNPSSLPVYGKPLRAHDRSMIPWPKSTMNNRNPRRATLVTQWTFHHPYFIFDIQASRLSPVCLPGQVSTRSFVSTLHGVTLYRFFVKPSSVFDILSRQALKTFLMPKHFHAITVTMTIQLHESDIEDTPLSVHRF